MTSKTDNLLNNTNNKSLILKHNITSVIMYALSMSTALAFNDLITIFDSYNKTKHVIVKTTYLIALFGFTIYLAVYLNQTKALILLL